MTMTNSSLRNMYVLKKTGKGYLVLSPSRKNKWISLILVILVPLVFGVGRHYNWPMRLCVGVTLLPALGAIAFGLTHFFLQRFGLHALFDPHAHKVVIRVREFPGRVNTREISVSSITTVLLLFTGTVSTHFVEKRQSGPGYVDRGESWDSYKLALTLVDKSTVKLIECGDRRSLEEFGSDIAKALRKPFEIIDKAS